jgi:hypothetical protein
MNLNRTHLRWLLPLLLVIILLGGVGIFLWQRASAQPSSTRASEMGEPSLSAQLAHAEYIYTWHEPSAAWLASNPAQGWQTAFGESGMQLSSANWHFGLRLSAWGRDGALQSANEPTLAAKGEKVTYAWAASLTEWYINDWRGIEQGFELAEAPSGTRGSLVLEIALDTNLTPSRSSDGLALAFNQAGQAVLRYANLLVSDAAGRSLPARLELANANTIRLIVDDSTAQYPITIDPLIASLQANTLAPDGAAFDRLGGSVALDGDTLVIGAAQADVGMNLDQGAVYIFQRDAANSWSLVRKLTAPDGAAYDEFGASLALSGDTLLVGAPCANTCRGTVYVFSRNEGGNNQWGQSARLAAADGAAYERFGASVALDGITALVGVPMQADARGAAYIFSFVNNTWSQTNKLLASDGMPGDHLGIAVALDGGLALIGADGAENGDDYDQGAAYLFARDQGGAGQWGEIRKLLASDGAANDGFGSAVAISGDYAACAATGAKIGNRNDQGAAWLFASNEGGPDTWGELRKFTANDGRADDGFGSTLILSGDILAIGAPLADVDNHKDQGAAYVYTRNEGGSNAWGLSVKINAANGAAGDMFARSLAISGDTLSAGIFLADVSGQRDQGGASVYQLSNAATDTPTPTATPTVSTSNQVVVTVLDTDGNPQSGLPVYAFNGVTYTGYSKTTNSNGQAVFTLPQGDYRFRSDKNGTQFWSGAANHCTNPGCTAVSISVTLPVVVTVLDTSGNPAAGLPLYAFNDASYTGYSKTTDANGQAVFTLPPGSYRFRADKNGTQFWSGDGISTNHCTLPGCTTASVMVTIPVIVTVLDTDGTGQSGLPVYAFNGTTYTGYNGITNAQGQVALTLPLGEYRFRSDKDGTQFWSGTGGSSANHCAVPGCVSTEVTTTIPLTVTVLDSNGTAEVGLPVYAFDGTTYTGYSKTTNANGQAVFTLPQGNYHFRADKNGTQFWSSTTNLCMLPGCTGATITTTVLLAVTVVDTDGIPQAGIAVYAFDGVTYTGYSKITDVNGQVSFTLPQGSYRFRADKNGTQFWSNTSNHCTLPGCTGASITVTRVLVVTVIDTYGATQVGLAVYAYDGSNYTGFSGITNAEGQVSFTLPQGSYRFRSDKNGTQFWSGPSGSSANHCAVPGCSSASITVTASVQVTVADTDGAPQAGLTVYAFNGTTYTGYSKTTNASGQAEFILPQGSYRFRSDKNGTQFWSGASNHCTVPGCTQAAVTVTLPVAITVLDTNGMAQSGLTVYAFDGTTYTGYSKTTNANGQATFTLPQGNYHFRADKNGTQFWSGPSGSSANHCTLPGCTTVSITVTPVLVVTVVDTDGTSQPGLTVYAFNDASYTGYSKTTDANGQATFTLPQGNYRFRADKNGTQFWSGPSGSSANHCSLPGCIGASIIVTKPLIVSVTDTNGAAQAGLTVYAFNGSTYTGYNKTTNAAGQAIFTLPQGNYRFRVDRAGQQIWSDAANHCGIPGCTSVNVVIPD